MLPLSLKFKDFFFQGGTSLLLSLCVLEVPCSFFPSGGELIVVSEVLSFSC